MEDGRLHVVVFPWLAFGHMIPFLELSKSMAERGHRISFVSTPRNIERLPKVPPLLSPLLHFVPLPLPPTAGLPVGAEATSDLPPDLVPLLKKAFDGLEQPFFQFISSSSPKPDWIIHDFAHHWVPRLAADFQLPCVFFSIFLAAALAFLGPPSDIRRRGPETKAERFTALPDWIPFPSTVAYRLHEAQHMLEAHRPNASGVSDVYRFMLAIEGCKAVAVRSCNEFESEWLSLLREELYKKPVVPVGLLPAQERQMELEVGGELKMVEWLNRQTPRSVVYVAFGSEATLSAELVHELALGLELSALPFLWALRNSSILPEGFEDRTRGRGVVAMGWVPQLKVLAHAAVGGFLTHCGWSSIIESLQFGHPLVLLPIFGDQGLNARVMEEKKIGFEVHRNEEDGFFSSEVVAMALRLVMVEAEGEPFRDKAKQMIHVFSNKSSQERYVDDFIYYLCNHKNN